MCVLWPLGGKKTSNKIHDEEGENKANNSLPKRRGKKQIIPSLPDKKKKAQSKIYDMQKRV